MSDDATTSARRPTTRTSTRLTFDMPRDGQYTYSDSLASPQTNAEIAEQLLHLASQAQKRALTAEERYGLLVEAAKRLKAAS